MPNRDHMMGYMPVLAALHWAPVPLVVPAGPVHKRAGTPSAHQQAQRLALDKRETAALDATIAGGMGGTEAAEEQEPPKKLGEQVQELLEEMTSTGVVFKGKKSIWRFGAPPKPDFYFAHRYGRNRVLNAPEGWQIPGEMEWIRYWDGENWSKAAASIDILVARRSYSELQKELGIDETVGWPLKFNCNAYMIGPDEILWSPQQVVMGNLCNKK